MSPDTMIAAFLQEHPKYIEDIRYSTVPGEDLPQAMMPYEGTIAFIDWMFVKGYADLDSCRDIKRQITQRKAESNQSGWKCS